jgi:hypothetical protein
VNALVDAATSRAEPVRRNELLTYLRALHPLIAIPLFTDMRDRGLWPTFVPPPDNNQACARDNLIKLIEATGRCIREEHFDAAKLDVMFGVSEAMAEQVLLIAQANLQDREAKRPITYIMGDFPRAYAAALDKLVHGDWYVACFTRRADNHSMWSTYSDGHKGICFMFRPTEAESGDLSLHLNRIVGASGSKGHPTVPIRNFVPHPIHPVRYSRDYPSIDFFRSLGRIRQIDMNNFWYLGDDGQFSACRDAVYSDEDTWRRLYWEKYAESALYKTPEWAHEEEYRVIAYSAFDMSAPEQRKFQFRFSDLAGIVFGARTTTDVKLKAMEIISRKCAAERRSDFKFFEIRYSTDAFQAHELSLLKFQNEDHASATTNTAAANA